MQGLLLISVLVTKHLFIFMSQNEKVKTGFSLQRLGKRPCIEKYRSIEEYREGYTINMPFS
jgi:hypothetical protein